MIVRLLPLSEMKRWDGTSPYDAIALPFGERTNYAARMTLRFARSNEVEMGVALLSACVKIIAGQPKRRVGRFEKQLGGNKRCFCSSLETTCGKSENTRLPVLSDSIFEN